MLFDVMLTIILYIKPLGFEQKMFIVDATWAIHFDRLNSILESHRVLEAIFYMVLRI